MVGRERFAMVKTLVSSDCLGVAKVGWLAVPKNQILAVRPKPKKDLVHDDWWSIVLYHGPFAKWSSTSQLCSFQARRSELDCCFKYQIL